MHVKCPSHPILLYLIVLIAGAGPRAARSEAKALDTAIVGSNPAHGMDVCPHLSILVSPVEVEALRRADHSSKESHQMSN
jgi:hypothetical protein